MGCHHGFATLEQKTALVLPININENLDHVLNTYFNGINQAYAGKQIPSSHQIPFIRKREFN